VGAYRPLAGFKGAYTSKGRGGQGKGPEGSGGGREGRRGAKG